MPNTPLSVTNSTAGAISSPIIATHTALPVLAAPHSLPATGFSILHLSHPQHLPSSKIRLFLIPECAQPALCLNCEESHVSIRQIIVRRASTRRAPAIASWPRARLRLTPTLEKRSRNLIPRPEVVSRSTAATARTNMPAVQTSPWNTGACWMRARSQHFVHLHLPVTK